MNTTNVTKFCSKCKTTKETALFFNNRLAKDGKSHYCKFCTAIINKPGLARYQEKLKKLPHLSQKNKTNKTCSVNGCDSLYYVQAGFCNKHYLRQKRHGDVNFVTNNRGEGTTSAARFWSRVAITADDQRCWEWIAGLQGNGYAKTTDENGNRILAHRYSWFLVHGFYPTQFLLHSCDNRRCVNPNHLREGTQKENMQDAIDRNRICRGENKSNVKLTDDDVLQIRQLLKTSMYRRDIAKLFNVHPTRISDIAVDRTWKHIQLPEDCK